MAKFGSGITNKQAKYLAALQRELRVPYSGHGMTRDEASIAIDELRAKVDTRREAQRHRMRES